MKILYIEDNPIDTDLTVRKLTKTSPDIVISTAKSQAEGLATIRRSDFSSYDLVLTDMHLQDGDGLAILSHIRGHSLPVAVVLLTGQGDEEAAVAALKAGADDYMVKKKGYLDKLPALLKNALSSYNQTKDNQVPLLKVLYLEHNQTDVDLTRRHLDRYAPHIQMDILHEVTEFYAKLDQNGQLKSYSALLLDYRLPKENALEVLQRITHSPHNTIPVILVTGKGDEEIAVKALKMGAFDYITKNQGYLFKLPSVIENAHYSMRLVREHESLLESEKRYRTLFEDSHVAMLLINPDDGKIVDANSASVRFYGWSKEQLKTKRIYDINVLATEDRQESMKVTMQHTCDSFISKHRLTDNSLCDVEVYSSPIEVGGQALVYSMVYDITDRIAIEKEREILQKKLLQAEKMEAFGQLAGGIAHDFNNILSAVIGFTELSLFQVEKGSPLEDNLNEVFTAGNRAKELVQQILAFARKANDELTSVSVSSIVKEVLKLIKSSTPSTIAIRQKIASKALVWGNAIQIHQILMNLCANAVYAMEDGGILEIILKDSTIENASGPGNLPLPPGDYVEITVSDTGSGIQEDIIDSIFDPYFTTKPQGEGTGMGLAMVQGIVETYGGTIQVQSTVGKGTVFTIYLPVAQGVPASATDVLREQPTGTERILFIDDEVALANLGGRLLERLGYTLTIMTDSAESLKLFASNPDAFDLVMTDVTMPVLTGDKLAVEMLKIRPDIPVILTTGYSRKIDNETVQQIGIKALIFKPLVTEQLAKIVRKVLDETEAKRMQKN